MKKQLFDLLRDLSSILAGFKLAIIVIGYIGIGSLAKWVIEQWYPFTRWVWNNVIAYFNFPKITDVEKDALTAMVFFLPLGITAAIYRIKKIEEEVSLRVKITSLSLGVLFVYLICQNVINFILTNSIFDERFNKIAKKAYEVHNENSVEISIVVVVIIAWSLGRSLVMRKEGLADSILEKIDSKNNVFFTGILKLSWYFIRALHYYERSFRRIGYIFMIVLFTSYGGIILFLLISLDSYLPLISFIFVVFIVIISVFYAPRKLMLAAGALLAFVSASYAYEFYQIAKSFIESSPK